MHQSRTDQLLPVLLGGQTSDPAAADFAALGDEHPQPGGVFVVDRSHAEAVEQVVLGNFR